MRLRDLRLSTCITVSALLLVTLGALGLMFIEEARQREIYFSAQNTELEKAFRNNELWMMQAVDTLRSDVHFLFETPPVSGIMRAMQHGGVDPLDGSLRETWEKRLRDIFRAFLAARPEYLQASYIGMAEGGRELVRSTNLRGIIDIAEPDRLQTKSDRPHFQASLALAPGQIHLSQIGLHRENGEIANPHVPTIHASIPVFDSQGSVFGLMVIDMRVDRLLLLATMGLPPGTATFITNKYEPVPAPSRCAPYRCV